MTFPWRFKGKPLNRSVNLLLSCYILFDSILCLIPRYYICSILSIFMFRFINFIIYVLLYSVPCNSVFFCSVLLCCFLLCSIILCSILFCFMLICSTLFYCTCSLLFFIRLCSDQLFTIPFYILLYSIRFCSILSILFYFTYVIFCSAISCFILFLSSLNYSVSYCCATLCYILLGAVLFSASAR